MAERASTKKRGNGKATNGAGHNSSKNQPGEASPELVDRYWEKIVAAQAAVERATKPLKTRKSELSAIYKAAKADGIDVPALRDAIAADKDDHLDVVTRYANTGKYLRAHRSPLGVQMNLFPLDPIPEESRAAISGKRAGLAGRSIDENPYTPGTDLFVAYEDAWHAGQEQVRSALD